MPKINIETTLFTNPKIRRLRLYCGETAEIYLIRLWCYAADHHPKDGSFKGYEKTEIEGLVGWSGPPGNLVNAFLRLGLLETNGENSLTIHDWLIHAEHVHRYAEHGRKMAKKRWKSKTSLRMPKQCYKHAIGNTIELNRIELNKDSIVGPPPHPVDKPVNNLIDQKRPLTDLQKVVTVFKLCEGVSLDDKEWDKLYFGRYTKSAKSLIGFMAGDWKAAGACVQDIYEDLTSKGLTVTFETIVKHASRWRQKKLEKEAKHGVLPLPSHGDRAINN